ncbi:MFS transporter [Spirochaeta isovalerica]|uniref:UMF1 family MFS transporter n=1 Tax=Spirochaeta isovalerica TaxID=150 RepID=A0A841R9G9_9SPIO|nr:MFS transporter [Spirochaeta isovalerica]MBB6479358.1 UMF1 family MFS transporter [Spirochaeta isovalerica]
MSDSEKLTKTERSWILYDVANSAFVLIVTTTLMPIFHKDYVAAGSGAQSTADWGFVVSLASLILAVLAPVLGTIADYRGMKKKFFLGALFTGVAFTLLFPLIRQGQILFGLMLYLVARVAYAGANIFYDSFLTDVTTNKRMDRISTLGFGWGYIGSCLPFIVSIGLIVGYQTIKGSSEISPLMMKISFVIVALWWFVFSLPMIKNVRQEYAIEPEPRMIRKSFVRLWTTLKEISRYKTTFSFLIAYFFYIDGVSTIISMATAYGIDLGFGATTLIAVILFIQIVAWPFALIFGALAKRFSARKMLFAGIIVYSVVTMVGFLLPSIQSTALKTGAFWFMAFLVATSQGGIQALSRSFFGKTLPKEKSAEFFGFYNIFGKFAAIVGPLLMALFTKFTGDSRYGVLSILILFVVGAILLARVPEPESD